MTIIPSSNQKMTGLDNRIQQPYPQNFQPANTSDFSHKKHPKIG